MSAPITLRVRNFLGVVKADIALQGIVIVGGDNGAGKSSLLEAACCAATQNAHARGLTTNKASAAVLKEGAQAGSVTLEYEGGAVRVVYPGCEVDQSGKPPMLGTALGIGGVRYMTLKADDRLKEVTDRFQAAPTKADFVKWMTDREVGSDTINALWERIETSGWDAVHKQATEHGTRLKGKWEQITGRRWGSAIAQTWMPTPLMAGEDYDLAAEEAAGMALKTELEAILANAAVGEAAKLRLRADAEQLAGLRKEMERLASEGKTIAEQAERLLMERAKHADIAEGPNYLLCPGCGATLRHVPDPKRPKLEAVTKHATPSEVHDAQLSLRRVDGDRARVAKELVANQEAQQRAQARIATALNASADLEKAEQAGTATEEDVAVVRDRSLLQDRKVAAVKQLIEARKVVGAYEKHQGVIATLAADGVRLEVLSRRLSEINAKLAELCALARFDEVALTPEFSATYNGRIYQLLSESEKWRVDVALALLFGQQEGAPFILIDRLDVLHNNHRPGVLLALKKLGLPALIACTSKDRAALPDLEKAKIGSVHWLTAGVLDEAAQPN